MMRKFFCSVLLLLWATLSGEIIETSEIVNLLTHIEGDTVVLFNVSSTLYEPAVTLADRKWREYFAERVEKLIADPMDAKQLINRIKNLIVTHVPKKAVEKSTAGLIQKLQDEHTPVFAISRKYKAPSYAHNFDEITYKHLQSLGIDLEATLAYFPVKKRKEDDAYSFYKGMIFTNKLEVGEVLPRFIANFPFAPDRIVMIDNFLDSLLSAQKAFEGSDIAFLGLHYQRHDRPKAFDPNLGTIQFFEFIATGDILTDEEAVQIKSREKGINYEELLDAFIKS